MSDLFTLSEWVESSLGGYHFWMAMVALVLGPVLFLRVKGSITHRVLGYAYIFAMLSVNAAALSMYNINGGITVFHVLAVASLAALIPGYVAIRSARSRGPVRARVDHMTGMAWSYAGLVMAGASQIVIRLAEGVLESWTQVYLILGVIIALGCGATVLMLRRAVQVG